jgi:hypothetical protein
VKVKKLFLFFLALTIFAVIGNTSLMAQGTVPPDMQASLFKKIFAYDKKLAETAELKVVVAFSEVSSSLKDDIVKAFQSIGISARAAKVDQLAANLGGVDAVYLFADAASAKAICKKNQILSITGASSLVESGNAAIGIGVEDKKPKIVVHLKELKEEGHEVSAKLLQLAKVIE